MDGGEHHKKHAYRYTYLSVHEYMNPFLHISRSHVDNPLGQRKVACLSLAEEGPSH